MSLSDRRGRILQKPIHKAGLIILAVVVILFGIFAVKKVISDPNIPLLFSEQGAVWIRFREPVTEVARKPQVLVSNFRIRFEVNEIPRKTVLNFRAMKRAAVLLDNKTLFNSEAPLDEWKKLHQIDLAPSLSLGFHELRIEVMNRNGHSALLAYCKPLGLFTGEQWEGSNDGKNWSSALSVNTAQHFPLSHTFQRADHALFSQLHIILPLFLVVFVVTLLFNKQDRPPWMTRAIPTAKGMRWILLTAWVILAINNIGKVPFYLGMDIGGHIEYIRFVSEKMRIPLATDGWQMFQPPLFYVLSAIIYKISISFFSVETVFGMLRTLPLLCGIAQVELCYRALRYVYPEREDLQSLGTVIGGLLPMNIYISQVVGNEPMAGFLTGVVIVLALRFLSFSSLRSAGYFLLVGLVLGLALLTKMSAIAVIPSLVFFIGYKIYLNRSWIERPTVVIVKRITLVLGVAFLVFGWYCIRNYMELGKCIIGGWDPITGFGWWQDPAYRTVQQFLNFGEALFYPVNSAIMGVWDSLYSTTWTDAAMSGHTAGPPWNYEFLFSSVWLSLLPSAAIFLGILRAFKKPSTRHKQACLFAASCTIVYVFAILYMFLTLPIYTTGKATYALGLTPCLALLCAAGFEILIRKLILRAVVYGIVACWAVNSYFAFFVVNYPDPAKNSWFLGKFSASHGRIAEAVEHYTEALQIDPLHLDAHNYLGCALVSQGKIDEAIVHYKKALDINPDFEDAYIYFGNALVLQGKSVEAIELFEEALRINPSSEEAQTYMGNALLAQGKVDEAINYYEKALEAQPGNAINALLAQGKIDEAMNYNTKALGTGIGPATIVDGLFKRPHFERVHLNLGNALVAQGKVNQAIDHYKEAVRIDPDFDRAHLDLGNALVALGRHDEAIVHYQEALRINPDFKEAHNSVGNALAARGQHKEAIEHYNKALGVDPEYADVYNNLGNALARQGRISEAIEYYRQALRLDPGFKRAHLRLGNALVRQGKTSEGIEHYLEALRLDPDFERAHLDLGDALVAQGKHDEGIDHYKEALRLNPDFMEAYNSLGDVLAAQGKLTEAIKHYSEVLRINPGFAEVHDKMGKALVRKGEVDKAIVHFREALGIRPDYVSAHKGLKNALRIQREIEKAVAKTKNH